MYYLETIFPPVKRVKIPLSRDQLMLLMAATNQIFLGVDIYLAHSTSGTIVARERIPIFFGPLAGMLLVLAGGIALRNRPLATAIANTVLVAGMVVGILGIYFHLVRAIRPNALPGQQVSINLLVWGPPILGPFMFTLVGVLGMSAAWIEDPPDSGRLRMFGKRHIQLPYSKTRAYFFIVGMGIMVTAISSVLDHARTQFDSPWLWIPTVMGVFGMMVAFTLGAIDKPTRSDLTIYAATMLTLIVVGVLGAVLHADSNLTTRGQFVAERFIRGAPFLAPLLFANVGTLGLIVLLDPRE